MSSHLISLFGREFRIRSEDTPDHVASVATFVNRRIEEVAEAQPKMPVQQVLLLASLNMADLLFKERANLAALKEKIRSQSRELLARLDRG
jgi:cell division protein ZapA